MPDPNLITLPLWHNIAVWLWTHGGLWTVAGFLAGWKLRGRLVAYSLGFGRVRP